MVIFPGGFGTFDELFESRPLILFDSNHWKKLINWDYLAECGLVSPEDLDIMTFCDKAEEAWKVITDFYA